MSEQASEKVDSKSDTQFLVASSTKLNEEVSSLLTKNNLISDMKGNTAVNSLPSLEIQLQTSVGRTTPIRTEGPPIQLPGRCELGICGETASMPAIDFTKTDPDPDSEITWEEKSGKENDREGKDESESGKDHHPWSRPIECSGPPMPTITHGKPMPAPTLPKHGKPMPPLPSEKPQ